MWTYNEKIQVDGNDSVDVGTDIQTDETLGFNVGTGTQVGYCVDGDDSNES